MSGFFALPGWVLPLARRALYFWVRTTVFPEQPTSLGIDPSKPVCYVLQDHHLSDLLVLLHEASGAGLPSAERPVRLGERTFHHAVFSLNRKHSLRATPRERYAHSSLMTALLHDAFVRHDADVQIVPVVVLWGRSPDKQDSILKALFSETWRQPGPLRRLLTILLHGRKVLVRFSAPISLGALSREGLDEAQAARKLSRVLRVHFRRQREMAIGPDLSHRNTQIDAVLASERVRAAIADEAQRHHVSSDEALARARRCALEIASDYSYGTLRAFELFCTWLWSRLYDGIEIFNVDRVTRIAPGQGVVYVPTHRSHIDYILLSYSLHRQGLTPPHIAAGANLNLPVVGTILRRSGAFFLRRSFKGEPLYAAVFHEYLHLMLTRGVPVEYFIEGGRSRSGRTLVPKAGILGMTVNSFMREHNRPLVFVPVYIGYEKVLEGRTYLRELAGKPKQRESIWGLLSSVRQLKRIYGKVYINFGEPLELSQFLAQYRPDWAQASADETGWPREATRHAAIELARRLNAAAVINPVNLMALALLSTPRHTADGQGLLRMLGHYQALLDEAPYSGAMRPSLPDPAGIVAHVERLGFAERVAHPLGEVVQVPDSEAPLLTYFRNNVLHIFALPALIACLVSHNRDLEARRLGEAVEGIYSLMASELFLHWRLDELASASMTVVDVLTRRGLLVRKPGGSVSAPELHSQEFAELRWLGETLRPILERHFLILALLEHGGSGYWTRRTLETDGHLLAQRLALLYASGTPDLAEKSTFAILVTQLIDANLLREDETGLLHFDARITTPLAHVELVLPAEARQAIRRMACTTERVA